MRATSLMPPKKAIRLRLGVRWPVSFFVGSQVGNQFRHENDRRYVHSVEDIDHVEKLVINDRRGGKIWIKSLPTLCGAPMCSACRS